ncbi:hypothetical protein ACQRIU_003267 [Beauveria bassiana]
MGQTALHWLAARGHSKSVSMIMKRLETEDDAIITDLDGRTAIHEAIIHDNKAVLDELLEHEVARRAIDQPDRYKRTALHWAAFRGRDDILQKLIDSGANLESTDNSGDTALQVATFNDQSEKRWIILLALIAKGAGNKVIEEAGVDATDNEGRTALLFAALKSHIHVIEALINGGANVNVEDASGSSPLGMAAKEGHELVVKLLLERGAKVNTRDKQGRSPLSYAAGSGSNDCVDLLLDAGAMVGLEDVDGMTPSSWAKRNGHEAIAKLLLEKENQYNSKQLQAADDED